MDVAVLVVRVLLAAVFAVAGCAKLADRRGSRKAVVDFGVPESYAGVAALALPLAELAVAAALLPAATATWALAGASGLLLAFTGAIGISIARGQAPDCHCFGQLHSEPAGPRTLARNLALLAVAAGAFAAALVDPGPSSLAWIGRLQAPAAAAVVLGALALAGAIVWFIVRDARRRAEGPRTIRPIEMGLPERTAAPSFALPSLEGPEVSLDELLRRALPVVLVFTDSGCVPCRAMLPELADVQREHGHAVSVVVLNSGDPDALRAVADESDLQDVLIDEVKQTYKAYEVGATPAAVRVEPPGEIATLYVTGNAPIRALVESTVTGKEQVYGLLPGEPVPDVAVSDPGGNRVRLTAFGGAETLFLFWDPRCGSCREIREELLGWERDPTPGTPQVVIVTNADGRSVQREGFRSPILVDRKRAAAEALGAAGTPAAVLVDADGRIAWPLAVGRRHIMRLIRSRAPVAA